ncbi:MAG: hypothetical protein U9O87_07475, partial [Verrucomicrobiota bacterium]|nr:hypothetical protein [Verrucomicrobiota bacterium]
MKTALKIIFILLCAFMFMIFLTFVGVSFFLNSNYFKDSLERQLCKFNKTEKTTLNDLDFSWTNGFTLKDLRIENCNKFENKNSKPFLIAEKIHIKGSLFAFLKARLFYEGLTINSLSINCKQDPEGTWNIRHLNTGSSFFNQVEDKDTNYKQRMQGGVLSAVMLLIVGDINIKDLNFLYSPNNADYAFSVENFNFSSHPKLQKNNFLVNLNLEIESFTSLFTGDIKRTKLEGKISKEKLQIENLSSECFGGQITGDGSSVLNQNPGTNNLFSDLKGNIEVKDLAFGDLLKCFKLKKEIQKCFSDSTLSLQTEFQFPSPSLSLCKSKGQIKLNDTFVNFPAVSTVLSLVSTKEESKIITGIFVDYELSKRTLLIKRSKFSNNELSITSSETTIILAEKDLKNTELNIPLTLKLNNQNLSHPNAKEKDSNKISNG